MNKQHLLEAVKNYTSPFLEEVAFQQQMIDFLIQNEDFALRSNKIGQITGSAWIINKERTKALLIHHKKLNKWLQIGGHIESSDQTIEETVLREIREESGIKKLKLLSSLSNSPSDAASSLIYDMDIHTIPAKNEVAQHLHFDIRLLVEADEKEELIPQEEEILNIKWYLLEDIEKLTENNTSSSNSIKRMVTKMQNIN